MYKYTSEGKVTQVEWQIILVCTRWQRQMSREGGLRKEARGCQPNSYEVVHAPRKWSRAMSSPRTFILCDAKLSPPSSSKALESAFEV